MHIYVSLVFCFFCILFPHLCILLLCDLVFKQLVSELKLTRGKEEGSLVRVGAMAEERKFMVKKFNDQNFQLWNMQMEYYIYQKDLYLSLKGKTNNFSSMKDKQ